MSSPLRSAPLRVLRPIVAVAALAAAVALAGCTSGSAPTGAASPSASPVADQTACLSSDAVATALGVQVTATATSAPPAGKVDAVLGSTARSMCSYTLADGTRLGFEPFETVPDAAARADALSTFFSTTVMPDDCTQVSGYVGTAAPTAPATYYAWTGTQFGAVYVLDDKAATDAGLRLAILADAGGFCASSGTSATAG